MVERFNSERYQAFLCQVLDQTSQHHVLIQDGARYHTSKATQAFFAVPQNLLSSGATLARAGLQIRRKTVRNARIVPAPAGLQIQREREAIATFALLPFFTEHQDCLTVFQLPSYSPDYNPIEFLWKKMKQRAIHNQYFAFFENLLKSVDEALTHFSHRVVEIKSLMSLYVQTLQALPTAA